MGIKINKINMSDFYRTMMGRKFYEKDLPSLISVLEKVANQMEIKNIREEKKFKLEEKVMKLQMKELNETLNKDTSAEPTDVRVKPNLKNGGSI